MKITLTFKTTERQDRGIAFACAHPGDGPTDAESIMIATLRERFEQDAAQADEAVAAVGATAVVLKRLAERSPKNAAYLAKLITEIEAQPGKEASVLAHAQQMGDALGVERVK